MGARQCGATLLLLLAVLTGSAAASRSVKMLGRELQDDGTSTGGAAPDPPQPGFPVSPILPPAPPPAPPLFFTTPPGTPVNLALLGALPPTGCDARFLGVPISLPAPDDFRMRLACPGGSYNGRNFDLEEAARMVCRNVACNWWEVQFYLNTDADGNPIDLEDVEDYKGTNWFDVNVGDPSVAPTPTVHTYLVPHRDEVNVTVVDITSGKRTATVIQVPGYATTADIKNQIYRKNGVYPQHQRLFLLDNGQPTDSEYSLDGPITLSGELEDFALVGVDDLTAPGAKKKKYRVPLILLVRTYILGHSIHLNNGRH